MFFKKNGFNSLICLTQTCCQFIFKRNYNNIPFEDIPEISSTSIKKSLKTHGVSYTDGFTCFITDCPQCHSNSAKLKGSSRKLYINKITGMFMCSSCKSYGQWHHIEDKFAKKKKKNGQTSNVGMNLDNIEKMQAALAQITDETLLLTNSSTKLTDILEKFNLPIISSNIIEKLQVRIDKQSENLYFPLEDVESDIVGYRILNCNSSQKTVPDNNPMSGLLIEKGTKYKDTAILVPDIPDFLHLLNAKVTHNVVCLPNGLKTLSQYVLPTLERFKKLIFWYGPDITDWESARQFAKKLGERRCLFIRPSDKYRSPHLLSENQDVKAIINSAQPIWHKSITTFASLREDVLSDLQNIDKVQGVKWKRYPALNKILKGHRRGELTVVTGPTGSGKTTFMSEYSLDLAMHGVNTLWGSFEIRNARLARTMLQQFAGLPLDENLQLFDTWADKFEQLPIYFMTFHGEQTIKVVMEAVEHATYVHDIAHVIIDNVQFMMGMGEEQKHIDRFWKQDAIIAAFRTFATRKNCHVSLVIHPRKEREDEDLTTSSIFGGAKASQEADNILILQDKRLSSVRGKKYLQVAKNRYSGDLGVMPLDFDKPSLSYAPKKRKNNEKSESNV